MSRILVVDDDAVTCRLLSEVLGRDGDEVVAETDPRRALARLADDGVDVAILDVQMPTLDGLELLRRLRERLPDVPVVVMTAFLPGGRRFPANVKAVLEKPLALQQLLRVIQDVLNAPARH